MSTPELSVIVPSVNGGDVLFETLSALAANRQGVALEVIVADRCGSTVRDEIRRRYPDVRVIEAPANTSIPSLRAMAMRDARGPAIAVIEDHVIVAAGWAKAMLAALERGESVVGGTVLNLATKRLVDRAAFLCEYSHMLPSRPAGPSSWITGNNTMYLRLLIEPYLAVVATRWEHELHDRLQRDDVTLYYEPDIVVGHKRHYRALEYAKERFFYARSYAGARFEKRSLLIRALAGSAALVLPPILLSRILGRVWMRPERWSAVLALPLLAFFTCSWAAGEMIGAWVGAGNALAKVS